MLRRCSLAVLLLLGLAVKIQAQEEKVIFSTTGGFYQESFFLELHCFFNEHHVRYTTNGTTPTAESPRYEEPLYLDESLFSKSSIYTIQVAPEEQMYYPDQVKRCIVIRAAVFDENNQRISAASANTYFIKSLGNDSHGMPLVSICADSLDLFDYKRGIFVPGIHFNPDNPEWSGNYFMTGMDWERESNVEFYELDNTGINQKAGLRTHGGNGRRNQQKNMALFAREQYGKKRFKHKFFKTLSINSFKHLQLKPFVSSWTPAGVQDPLCQAIASQSVNVESLATRPAILFLNGEYWGIYYLHEKPDERYLESHFGVDPDDCDIMANWVAECEEGHCDDFVELIGRLENADLSDPSVCSHINDFFDLDSFIDYQILEMFLVNTDWPANNVRCWRTGNGKWRWIFYDADGCLKSKSFGVFENAIYRGVMTWPSSTISTVLFRRLLANENFRNRFFERFYELIDTRFQYSETRPLLLDLEHKLQNEIPTQAERFGNPVDMHEWTKSCQDIDNFLKMLPKHITKQLDKFIKAEPWNYGECFCYPTPFTETLSVSFHTDRSENTSVNIFDVLGRCLYSSPQEVHSGSNTLILNPELPSGSYILTLGKIRQHIIKL